MRSSRPHAPLTCKTAGNLDSAAIAAHPCGGQRNQHADQSEPPAARLCRRDFPLRRAAVRRAADVHQDGAAAARRHAVGVVGRDGVLPGRAARRLRLRARADELFARQALDHRPSRRDGGRVLFLPLVDRHVVGPPAGRRRPRRSGCSACSRCRSACRSSRSRPTARCCRPGSRAPIIRPPPIRTSSMRRAISAASSR